MAKRTYKPDDFEASAEIGSKTFAITGHIIMSHVEAEHNWQDGGEVTVQLFDLQKLVSLLPNADKTGPKMELRPDNGLMAVAFETTVDLS